MSECKICDDRRRRTYSPVRDRNKLLHVKHEWKQFSDYCWQAKAGDCYLTIFCSADTRSTLDGRPIWWDWDLITPTSRIKSDGPAPMDWHAATRAEEAYEKYLKSQPVQQDRVIELLEKIHDLLLDMKGTR